MVEATDFLFGVGRSFFTLFIIMSPFIGLPVFLKIVDSFDERRRKRAATRAIFFSAGLLLFFILFGMALLNLFGVSFEGFKIAGGIVLLILGITYMFNISLSEKKSVHYATDILVPFAMPLIIGPGTITATILLTNTYGIFIVAAGGILALGVYWLFLHHSSRVVRTLGHQGIEVVARFMGLILMAIAVDMMRSGVSGFIKVGFGG